MKKSPESLQLDLTASLTDVPQANSLPLFIRFMEALRAGHTLTEDLATILAVEARTVHYYADFGRWLGFVQSAGASTLAMTEMGQLFAESVPARSRLFSSAIFGKKLVQTAQALKREALEASGRELDTQQACLDAILAMTTLAQSTAERRASALASMLQWAYKPSALDWSSGEPYEEMRTPFDFQGQSFLTAMAARQFGAKRTMHVAFPRQVLTFTTRRAQGLHAKYWTRASYDLSSSQASWFGSVPLNNSTIAVAERGGPDLRRLLILCAPYVSLVVALLTLKDAARRPLTRLTQDMYGPKIWYRDIVLGAPLPILDEAAQALGLNPLRAVPHLEGRHTREDLAMGSDADLFEVLLGAGITRLQDTSFVLATGFEEALHKGNEALPPLAERLQILQPTLQSWLRERNH